MRSSSKLLVGLILSALALGLIVPQATAGIHYRRAIGIAVDNNDPWNEGLSFQRPGNYHATLRLVVWPLWYYVDDLTTYDTVTMTLALRTYKMLSHGSLPILFGDNCASLQDGTLQCTWTNVHLSQDEDGVTLEANLYLGMDLIVGPDSGAGLYHLTLDAIATAPGVIFEGHTFVTLLVYP